MTAGTDSSSEAPVSSGLQRRRRRGGVSGMVLAELRELAGTLGVEDTAGMRRADLVAEVRQRQGLPPVQSGQSREREQTFGRPAHYRLDEPPGGVERRGRGGVSGMVLAELRELAGTLGVEDTTGMRRGDLIEEIKKRQEPATEETEHPSRRERRASRRFEGGAASSEDSFTAADETRYAESDVLSKDDPATAASDSHELNNEASPERESLEDAAGSTGGDGLEPLVAMAAPDAPPPKARFLLALSILLAPGERENWRAELETARWELRGDPRSRRRASRSHLRHLLGAAWTSWRHSGRGSATEFR